MRRIRLAWLLTAMAVTVVILHAFVMETFDHLGGLLYGYSSRVWSVGGAGVPRWVSEPLDATIVLAAGVLALALVWRAARPAPEPDGPRGASGAAALAVSLAGFAWLLQVADPTSSLRSHLFVNGPMWAYADTVTLLLPLLGDLTVELMFVISALGLVRFAQTFPTPLTADRLRSSPRQRPGRVRLLAWWMKARAAMNRVAGPLGQPAGGSSPGWTKTLAARLLNPWILIAAGGLGIVLHRGLLALVGSFYLPGRSVWTGVAEIGPFTVASAWAGEELRTLFLAVAIVVPLALSAYYFQAQYRSADEEGRERLRWIGEGLLILTGTAVLVLLVGLFTVEPNIMVTDVPELPLGIATLLFLGCLAMATFFSGAFDSELVLRKSTLYGITVVILTFLFAGTEELVTSVVADRLGASGIIGTWLAAGVVALVVMPLHERLQRTFKGPEVPNPVVEPEGGGSLQQQVHRQP